MNYRLGRLPRKFDPRVPHYSTVRLTPGIQLAAAPPFLSYINGIPAIGMLGNDQWGCCAFAAAAHLIQVWQWNATGKMPPIDTPQVLQGYSEVTGFDISAGPPGSNPTDQGTCLQDMLAWWLKTGFPLADGSRHKIIAYFELDPRHPGDLDLATAESGGILCGINVPAYLQQLEAPGSTWDVETANAASVGGHAISSAGYVAGGNREAESWGSTEYEMTPAFMATDLDEAYAIVSPEFGLANGKTPFGLPLSVWQAQMAAIREAA